MKVSVAMCTYNGERYLKEQLVSISQQSQAVQELVVCDDGSTDDTIKILENFQKNIDIQVFIYQNSTNLGSTKNFEKCLNLCTGDIIFLCDQDDIWHKKKVEIMTNYLIENPKHLAVFTDARIINENSEPTGSTGWEAVQFDKKAQALWKANQAEKLLFTGFVVTGATLAIRKEVLAKTMPFPTEVQHLIHDGWIALFLAMDNAIGFIQTCLTDYRVHASQQVGFGKAGRWVTLQDRFKRQHEEKLKPIKEKAENLQKMYFLLESRGLGNHPKLGLLFEVLEHYKNRAMMPKNRFLRIYPAINEQIKGRYSHSSKAWWLPFLGDVFE